MTPYYSRAGVRREMYQRRYVLYALSNGRTPEEQAAHDKRSHAGFINWVHEQSRLFDQTGRAALRNDEFGEWLERKFAVDQQPTQGSLWE